MSDDQEDARRPAEEGQAAGAEAQQQDDTPMAEAQSPQHQKGERQEAGDKGGEGEGGKPASRRRSSDGGGDYRVEGHEEKSGGRRRSTEGGDGDHAKPKLSRRSRSRSRDRKERKERRRSRSRSKGRSSRRHSRSRSRDRRRSSRHRSRSRSRDRRRSRSHSRGRDRSRDRRRSSRRRSASGDREGMGGYQPRRRAEVQDPKPAGVNNAYYDPFYHLRQQNKVSNPADALRQWQEQQLQARLIVMQQQAASALAAASKTQRELYIGNLQAGQVTDEALRQVFDSALMAAFPESSGLGAEPVVNINMHTDGRYAFIEFRKSEYATAALALNGQVQLMGQAISVGRPAAYVDPTKAQAAAEAAAEALAQFRAGNTSVLAAAGVPAAPGLPPPKMPSPVTVHAPPAAGVPPPMPPPGGPPAPTPSTCLSISGVVTLEAMTDEVEYEETIEDLKEESVKAGEVMEIHIPKPADPEQAKALFGTGNYGKAFIQFTTAEAAAKARTTMHGRMFAGNMVTVLFMSEEAFQAAKV